VTATISTARIAGPGSARRTDKELLAAYHATHERRIRDQLVERFLPFARKMALRYNYTHEPMDDLVQVASLGLLKAIDRFDPARGHRFTSFAAPTILGELKRHFRDKGWGVHVPRDLQERALKLGHEKERLSQRLGRSPTLQELAEVLGCSLEQVLEAIEVVRNYEPASLEAPARDDDDTAALVELIGNEEDGFELAEKREAISRTWQELSELERKVVALRCVHDMTQREIGEQIGYSQMHVSRLLRRSVTRLVEPFAENDQDGALVR
jgi:RNA polymerase sigma-B factor